MLACGLAAARDLPCEERTCAQKRMKHYKRLQTVS